MRRLVAVLSSVAVALGLLVGVSAPASAANVGTVAVTGGVNLPNDPPTVNPSTITGQVGDTFQITYSGSSSIDVESSAVSEGANDCSLSPSPCSVSGTAVLFTINGAGSVVLAESGGKSTTLTIVIGGGDIGPTDPALVYPTAYLNANGGTCSGANMQVTKWQGGSGQLPLPAESACSRSGYRLGGWARTADARASEFDAGSVVPIGTDSFTLYAVWVPTGVLITYDANIGADSACIDAAGNDVPAGEGRTVTELNPETLASSAPCAPDNDQLELIGWATSGDGPVAYALGGPEAFDAGSRQTLYAVWQPTFTSICGQGEALRTRVLAYSCMDFGDVPVGWRSNLEVRITNVSGDLVGETVFPFSDITETSNGILERVRLRDGSECEPRTGGLKLGESCIVRFAWTPVRPGPMGPIRLRVCSTLTESCYNTPEGEGLRGNAYLPTTQSENSRTTTD